MYNRKVKGKIQCLICPHECVLQEGKYGICGVRGNIGGSIKCKVSGFVTGYAFDPIEKKPLYHFYPGSKILSIGSYGCNLSCNYCQNWKISQAYGLTNSSSEKVEVQKIINDALLEPKNIGIAYTYNEPTVWYEFMYDVAVAAESKGLKNVMVSNGFINPAPLELLLGVIDAFNIDLKAFNESFYNEMTGSRLQPVLDTLKIITNYKKHLEITNLIIPRKNDDPDLFREMVAWIATELGTNTVLHLTRYFPKYKQSLPPTPPETLFNLYKIAKEYLPFVYLGNLNAPEYTLTPCPNCKMPLISREDSAVFFHEHYSIGKCNNCGAVIPIVDKIN